MSSMILPGLAAVSVVLALAVGFSRDSKAGVDPYEWTRILDEGEIPEIDSIKIERKGEFISMNRDENFVWNLKSSNGEEFFASGEKIANLLNGLGRARVVRRVFQNSAHHAEVGIDQPMNFIFKGGEQVLSSIRTGFHRKQSAGVYFALADRDDVYVSDRTIDTFISLNYWQLRKLIDIPGEQIKTIDFSFRNGETFQFQRHQNEASFGVELGGVEQAKENEINEAARYFENVRFSRRYPKNFAAFKNDEKLQKIWLKPEAEIALEMYSGTKFKIALNRYQRENSTFHLAQIVPDGASLQNQSKSDPAVIQMRIVEKVNPNWLFEIDPDVYKKWTAPRSHYVKSLL